MTTEIISTITVEVETTTISNRDKFRTICNDAVTKAVEAEMDVGKFVLRTEDGESKMELRIKSEKDYTKSRHDTIFQKLMDPIFEKGMDTTFVRKNTSTNEIEDEDEE